MYWLFPVLILSMRRGRPSHPSTLSTHSRDKVALSTVSVVRFSWGFWAVLVGTVFCDGDNDMAFMGYLYGIQIQFRPFCTWLFVLSARRDCCDFLFAARVCRAGIVQHGFQSAIAVMQPLAPCAVGSWYFRFCVVVIIALNLFLLQVAPVFHLGK